MGKVSIALVALFSWLSVGDGVAGAAPDPFAWTPRDAPAVVRGREAAKRFDLLSTWEITLEVDNAFTQANRRALAALERNLARIDGVRRVLGPSSLLSVAVDAGGDVSTRPLFDSESGEIDSDAESDAIRQEVGRRADAAGWFVSTDGRTVRLLVDSDDFDRVRPAVAAAIAGGALRSAPDWVRPARVATLWPDPRDALVSWLPLAMAAGWILFIWIAGAPAWRDAGSLPPGGLVAVMIAAGLGAFCLFALSSMAALRELGGRLAVVAVATTALVVVIERMARRPFPFAVRRARIPAVVVGLALIITGAVGANVKRVRLETTQWRAAPLLFVSVRGDLDEPVVLREVRRLTDFLRAQPGIAAAWSVADFFQGVDRPGEDVNRIPDATEEVRRVLAQAHGDPALRLELSGDHREALVVMRFEPEADFDRPAFFDRLSLYLDSELRGALYRVDLSDPLPPTTRALARGLLANDATERILRICARAGRNLGDPERQSIERVARRAALIPVADVGKLRGEVSSDARAFLRARLPSLAATERDRVAIAVAALDGDTSVPAIWSALGAAFGPGHPPAALGALVPALSRQLGEVRIRHAARIHFKDMLSGAGLPLDGNLADEVRSATREGMGPVVGIPVPRNGGGSAFLLDARAVGGAANDRALSAAWLPGLRSGAIFGAVGLALILLLVAGWRGVLWFPLGLALPLAALIVPVLTRDPVGLLFISFLAATGAAGAALATSLAARRSR